MTRGQWIYCLFNHVDSFKTSYHLRCQTWATWNQYKVKTQQITASTSTSIWHLFTITDHKITYVSWVNKLYRLVQRRCYDSMPRIDCTVRQLQNTSTTCSRCAIGHWWGSTVLCWHACERWLQLLSSGLIPGMQRSFSCHLQHSASFATWYYYETMSKNKK